jgi:hypothetical protein|tara:strand:+ start:462 stop:650 length:189 start_codon:yes stop_codon:yes gene_type:complete
MAKDNKFSTLKYVNLDAKRGIKEEYKEYRNRMSENYYKVKYYLRGELFWDSLSKGTYRRTKR